MTTVIKNKKVKKPTLTQYVNSLTLAELSDLCDDPARDQPGGAGEVSVILTYSEECGFFLSAQDGGMLYSVREKNGDPVKYRTIEQAIEVLQDVLFIRTEVRLDISASSRN